MYWITRLDDGRFLCEYRIQDGTEEFTETDPDRAVSRLIEAGKFMNGTAPTHGDIRWYQEEEYTTSGVRRVPIAGPPRKCSSFGRHWRDCDCDCPEGRCLFRAGFDAAGNRVGCGDCDNCLGGCACLYHGPWCGCSWCRKDGPPAGPSPAVGPCPADDVGEAKGPTEPAWKTKLKAMIDRL